MKYENAMYIIYDVLKKSVLVEFREGVALSGGPVFDSARRHRGRRESVSDVGLGARATQDGAVFHEQYAKFESLIECVSQSG